MNVFLIWLEFMFAAGLIGVAGYGLVVYGHIIAERTGLGATLIGIVLISTITSLPELATGISAVAITHTPNLAVGDALGSCIFNLLILLILEMLHPQESIYARAAQGHALAAGLGIVLLAIITLGVVLSDAHASFTIGHVSIVTPLILVSYVAALRLIYRYERQSAARLSEQKDVAETAVTLRGALWRYAACAAVVLAAGSTLPFLGEQVALAMGWNNAFMGTLFMALSTSFPEIAVTVSAARLKALDIAVANLMGSNLFDVGILAIDDIFYLPGPLLAEVSPVHAVTAVTAIAMTAIVIVALLYRPRTRILWRLGWTGVLLLVLYALNSYVVFRFGE